MPQIFNYHTNLVNSLPYTARGDKDITEKSYTSTLRLGSSSSTTFSQHSFKLVCRKFRSLGTGMRPLVRDSHSYTAQVPGILKPSWMQSLLHLHESMQAGRRKKNSSNQLGHKISTKTKTQAHPSSLLWFPFTPREGRQNKRSHLIIQLPVETGNLLVVFLFLLCRDAGHDWRDVVNDRGVITGLQVLLVLRADLLILGHGFSCGHTNHGQGEGAGSPKPWTSQAGPVQLLRGSQQSQRGPRTAPRAGTGQAVAMDKGERHKSGGPPAGHTKCRQADLLTPLALKPSADRISSMD